MGLQGLRPGLSFLPVHIREPHRVHQRRRARGRRPGLRLPLPATRRRRGRPRRHHRGEGLLHRSGGLVRQRARAGTARREPQRDAFPHLQEHRGLRDRHGLGIGSAGPVRRRRRQLHETGPHGGPAQRQAHPAHAGEGTWTCPTGSPRSIPSATPTSTS